MYILGLFQGINDENPTKFDQIYVQDIQLLHNQEKLEQSMENMSLTIYYIQAWPKTI